MKKVLLTGATGLIGKHAIPFLIEKGFEVYAVARNLDNQNDVNVKWIQANLFNKKEIEKVFEEIKPNYLLHFAWDTRPGIYIEDDSNYKWKDASLDMLKTFHKNGGKRAVYAGSCFEYELGSSLLKEEETPCNPQTKYGKCKNELNKDATSYSKENGISFGWGRIFYVYGENEQDKRLFPYVINSLKKDEKVVIKSGDLIKDYMYAVDIAQAFVEFLDSKVEGNVNICSNTPVKIKDLVSMLANKVSLIAGEASKEKLVKIENEKTNQPPVILGDNTRLKNEVGFEPKFSLEHGIEEILEAEKKTNPKLKMFCFYHQPSKLFKTDVIEPMQNGANSSQYNLNMLKDNTGDNISDKNKHYGEITGEYWVWKNYLKENPSLEYVGFCHYRRFLDFNKKAISKVAFGYTLGYEDFEKRLKNYTQDKIYPIIKDYDIIIAEPNTFHEQNLYEQYKAWHPIKDMDLIIEIVKKDYPEYVEAMNEVILTGNEMHLCLNFVMKKELFKEYMNWIMDLLEKLEKASNWDEYTEYNDIRTPAFLAERFFNVWLKYKVKKDSLKVLKRRSLLLTDFSNNITRFLSSSYRYGSRKKFYQIFGGLFEVSKFKFAKRKYLKAGKLKIRIK